MGRLCGEVVSGLLMTLLVAGCDRDIVEPVPKTSVSRLEPPTVPSPRIDARQASIVSPSEVGKRATVVRKNPEPIVVRVKYRRARGPCLQTGNSWALLAMDAFDVVEVVQGRLKATTIDVRPLTLNGSGYPKNIIEGNDLILRLTLSEESLNQAQENERQGSKWLFVNGDEVDQVIGP